MILCFLSGVSAAEIRPRSLFESRPECPAHCPQSHPHLFVSTFWVYFTILPSLKIPDVGKDRVHHAFGFLVGAKISAGHDNGIASVIKLINLSTVPIPLRRQGAQTRFFLPLPCCGRFRHRETGGFSPFKAWGQRGLKVFCDLLGIAFVNSLIVSRFVFIRHLLYLISGKQVLAISEKSRNSNFS